MEDNIKSMPNEIIIDDGRVKYPIRNLLGEVLGELCFNPTDVGMAIRYNETVEKLHEIITPLEHVNIRPDGTAEEGDIEGIHALSVATENLFEIFDYLLGGNVSETFFSGNNPFSPVKGYFYCERVLEAVGKIIAAHQDIEIKQINKRLNRYTQGYTGKPNRAQRRGNKRRR